MKKNNSSYQKLFRATLATTVATGALVAAVPTFSITADAKSTTFTDVKETHHFYESVMDLTARGVINGYEDGTYRPGENISRAHAAKIMALALDLDTVNVKDPGFKDVPKSHPYYGHIAALVEKGIIKGYEDNTFRPTGNLTRAHIAQMLVIGFELDEMKLANLPFKDINSNQWFANYIQTLYSNEITTGTTATTFSPNAFVTRGQVASFIYRSELTQTKGVEVIGFSNDKLELADGTYNVHADLQDIFNDANLPALKGALVKVKVENDTIVEVTSIELKANGTSTNTVALDGNGSTFTGNVIVNGDYVSLKNLTVKGDLEIGKQVANSFTADKLTVAGKTRISDKAATAAVFSIAAVKAPSFVFNNSTIGTVEVTKKGATVEAKGTTKVQEVVVSSNVTLKADAGITIPKVSVKTGASQVTLDANIGSLNINSTGNLTLAGTGNIKEVKVESEKDVNFETKGKIDKLTVTSKDAKISLGANTRVGDITLPAGVSAKDIIQDYDKVKGNIEKVDGKTNPDAKPGTPSAGGGGGGGGGSVGGGDTGVTYPGNALLNQNLQTQLGVGNSAAGGAVSIALSGNTFTVVINKPGNSISDFETEGEQVFNAFKTNNTVVDSTSVTLSGNTNSIVINKENVNNDYDFGEVIKMALDLAQATGNTTLSYLENKNMVITVNGTIDGNRFNDTYTFNFEKK